MAERLLLDTQAVILWATDERRLPVAVRRALTDGERPVYFSPVSAMEIATKVRIGKLDSARPLSTAFADQMTAHGFVELPLTAAHAEMAGGFVSDHNDPWDRLLAAQARVEQLDLVTSDDKMAEFGVRIFWK